MMREWRRLYRARGFAPFGMVLVLLLGVLVMVDQVSERWDTTLRRREELQHRLAAMRAVSERSRQIDAALEAARSRVASHAGRILTAPDSKAAGDQLAQGTERWLVSLGAKSAQKATGIGGSSVNDQLATAEVAVRIMPRQLLRVLGDWQRAPLAMRLVGLELTVDNPDSPTVLDALFRVEGVYQRTESDSSAGVARKAAEPQSTRAQDAR